MAIQTRRGNYADFNPANMLPGEIATVLDNRYVFVGLNNGQVVQLGTMDAIEEALAEAQEYAESAEDSASSASTDAATASTKSAEASTSASTATTQAGVATTQAANASASASNANRDGLKAEGYAVGKQNNVEVTIGNEYYQNNAKFYATQAQNNANTAVNSASSANMSKNNAKLSEDNAAESEENAVNAASNAHESSVESQSYARGGTDSRAGEDTDNALYYKNTAQSLASTAVAARNEAQNILDAIEEKIIHPVFTIDFATGEIMYTEEGTYNFTINTSTGNLEWEVVA